jgi:WD40 repeat protein/energy-coupling factor transporter ATP-binding protein EcfA2
MATSVFHANPFPGIRSYEIDESHLFFGRESQVKELIEKLKITRFLAIVGSSGCGKSSLIKAGLIPELLKFKPGDSQDWELAVFRPGDDPVGNLAKAVFPATTDREAITAGLRAGKNGLAEILRDTDFHGKAKLIFIDQFEELFRFTKTRTSSRNTDEAKVFIDLILKAAIQPEIPVFIVLSMRTDFLDDCTEFRGLSEMINKGYYLVPRMNDAERKEAITGPIRASGHQITEELVNMLMNDVGDDPDQLPILQHALMRTWDYWKINKTGDQPIGVEHYQAIGTMKEALSVHLEEIYAELNDSRSKYDAEKLFKALTDITKESRGTRRPTSLGEICTLTNSREEDIIEVIDHFRKPGCAFLMPAAHVQLGRDSTIDISHESIMRVWNRLKKWVEEEMESAQLYMRLSKSAELYQEGKGGLWVNPELQLALQWKEQTKPNATWAMRYDPAFERAVTFLEYSKKQHQLEITKKEQQQKRNLKRARNSAIFLGFASVVSILFLIISLNLRFRAEASSKEAKEKEKLAVIESKKAEEQRKEAILQKRISEQQQQIALQQEMISDQQRQYAVEQQGIAQEQRGEAIEQRKQADISRQEALMSRDEAQMQRKEAISQKQIADQERIKAEESEKIARRLRLLATSKSLAIQALQLSSTVRDDFPALLAVTAFQMNRDNGGNINDPTIYSALSAISGDPVKLRGHSDAVRSAVLTRDGMILFSCGDDRKVLQWDMADLTKPPETVLVPQETAGAFRALTLTRDDEWLIAGTKSGKILVWERDLIRQAPKILDAHAAVVNGLVRDPRQNKFYSCGSDGRLVAWSYGNDDFKKLLLDSVTGNIRCLAISPQGTQLVYGTEDGEVRSIRLEDQQAKPSRITKLEDSVLSVTFDHTGQRLAIGSRNGAIYTISPVTPGTKLQTFMGRHASGVTGLAFSSTDQELASSGFDWLVRLSGYPLTEERPVTIESHELWVYGVRFTPGNKYLVSFSADKTLTVVSTQNEDMAQKLKLTLKRNLTRDEWNRMVGEDVPYQKTFENLP